MAGTAGRGGLAFKHVLDEDAALGDFLVDDELFIIRGDEENHCCFGGQRGKEEMEMEKKRGRRQNSRAEIAFSRAWSLYVSILPFRTASTRKSTNDLAWPLARVAVAHGLEPFLPQR